MKLKEVMDFKRFSTDEHGRLHYKDKNGVDAPCISPEVVAYQQYAMEIMDHHSFDTKDLKRMPKIYCPDCGCELKPRPLESHLDLDDSIGMIMGSMYATPETEMKFVKILTCNNDKCKSHDEKKVYALIPTPVNLHPTGAGYFTGAQLYGQDFESELTNELIKTINDHLDDCVEPHTDGLPTKDDVQLFANNVKHSVADKIYHVVAEWMVKYGLKH